MSLTSALGAAMSGLNVSQAGIDVTSRNIANVGTPGYTRKVAQQTNLLAGGEGIGVRREAAQRQIDDFLQQQLRTASAGTAGLNIKSGMLSRIDAMFGAPNSNASIAGAISSLATMLQELVNNPESDSARASLLNEAGNLAAKMNRMSDTIQDMRLEAERNIAAGVEQANALLQTIAQVNNQISQRQAGSMSVGDLQDKRDMAIDELSRLMDVKVDNRDDGTVTIFTSGGQLLLDRTPVELTFDERTQIDATSTYENGGMGTIRLVSGSNNIDLIAAGAIRSGALAGYVEMRDSVLPQAQAQLDELAAQLALSLSEETVASTAAVDGAAEGFEIDTASMLSGNTISLTYSVGGVRQNVTIVRVDDPSVLPLSNSATANPNDMVIGLNFNQPIADIVTDLQAALPPEVVVSNPSGSVLRFLDDGAANTSDIEALSAAVTPAGLADGSTGLALFVDGPNGTIFSNSLDVPPQKAGFASRIHVNPALLADDTLLVSYDTDVPLGDSTRPLDLLARLTSNTRTYMPSTGIGGTASPFNGSVDEFARRLVSFQSSQAANAERDASAQQVVSSSLQDRFDAQTGVNIDDEMSNLLLLQNAYSANARVISTIQDLFNVLMSIGR
ncbi:MAG: flagellar hook-associated protein FlgK [Alphaproteobacteria bacterium]|nr:flagellar hook-associated protein FlgK [Alphaproteobacteria bacterium]MDX5414889.1 flagellar hook-associated protein FlgK [Alphaproteobacteria bacterium]MDX5492062.1 flagellar hook-associated protein FlgK [Alphaproteobacteria bacterium]